ncbi:hypothetical protein LHP98_13590 [Rhodobacter sp. Har01]|nr:hypothetical protein [Rhodobacter sp. Har01]
MLLAVFLVLRWRTGPRARPRTAAEQRPFAVIDGSNVMHWHDNRPDLAPVAAVVETLRRAGYQPGVIFDANAGYKLANRYQGDAQLAYFLDLPAKDVLVVPKGQQADPFLLDFARDTGAIVISNDRFRDRIADYPELATQGRLIRGDWRDGKVVLDFPNP